MDRGAGACAGQRRSLRLGSGAAAEKQTAFAAAHDGADAAARNAGMPAVWLRIVSDLHANLQTKTQLLSLHRLGRISSAQRTGVYKSASATGQPGPVRVG